jgi:hypothetical protein
MMTMPSNVSSRWLATLKDKHLLEAEAQLYADFHARETLEKSRAGARYVLLQGPSALVNAWQQWLLVNNEARARGVVVHRAAAKSR